MSGPRELHAGDATFAKSFNKISRGENGEQLTVGSKAPKGREFVTMLLGDVEAGQAWVDIEVMLNELGFYRDDTLRTANQRLELAAQVSAQDANDAERKCQRLEGEVKTMRELLTAWRRMFDGGIASGELGVLRGQTDAVLRDTGEEQ